MMSIKRIHLSSIATKYMKLNILQCFSSATKYNSYNINSLMSLGDAVAIMTRSFFLLFKKKLLSTVS